MLDLGLTSGQVELMTRRRIKQGSKAHYQDPMLGFHRWGVSSALGWPARTADSGRWEGPIGGTTRLQNQ